MELTFSDLNNQMEYVLTEYKRALNNGNYTRAKEITASVLQLFRDTYGVDLDTKPEFDHVFQEVMTKMQTELQNSRPTTIADVNAEIEIINMFTEVANGVFKVADVRRKAMEMDPTAQDLIDTYQEGIKDAEEQIERLNNLKKQYDGINAAIYGKDIPNLKGKIDDGKFNVETLDIINEQIDKMNQLQIQIDRWESEILADPSKEAMYRGKINANQNEINSTLSNVRLKVNDIQSKGVNTDSIKDAMSTDNATRILAVAEVISLRRQVNSELTADYTQLMNNIVRVKNRYGSKIPELANIDTSTMDPSTKEGREAIEASIRPFMELSDRVQRGLKLQNNRKKVYEQSIEEVKEERKILEIDVSDKESYERGIPDDVKDKIEQEKEYYRQDMIDKLYGNPEKAEKWKDYYSLFNNAKKVVPFTFFDEAGNTHNAEYMTIDYEKFSNDLAGLNPPVEMNEALKLLQLEEYKERLERLSKYMAGDKSVRTELPSYKKYIAAIEAERNATTDAQREMAREQRIAAETDMAQELKEDQIYIATNHGATNNNELISEAIANAGSLVKYKNGRMAYKDQPTIGGKIKAFGHNYGSLVGLRTVGDAKTIPGKVATVVLDAGLIAISPFSAAIKTVYRYTPVIGKEAQAKRFIKKHAGENSSPYEGRADARKMKRRKEYKKEMKGLFKGARAWIKATNDDLFNSDRAEQTERDFMEKELQERVFPSVENRYIRGAQEADRIKQEQAKQNIEQRKENARIVAGRAYGYNDLIRDPSAAEHGEFEKQAILGATLEQHGEDAELLRYSKTDRPRDRRFQKEMQDLGPIHTGLDADKKDYSPVGSVVQSDSLDRATRQEAVQSTYTARNYVPYTITGVAVGMAGRYVASRIQTEVEKIIPGETKTVSTRQIAGYEKYETEVQVPHTTTQLDTSTVARTPAEFAVANDGQNVHLHRSVWGGERGGYDVDLSSYDNATAFYVDIPTANGGVQKLAIAITQDGGKYDYLGTLVDKYGLSIDTVKKYMDVSTGTFKPHADLYDLAAEISNATGATQGLTGDKLVEMVFNNGGANAYVESVKTFGGKNGGWFDVTKIGQSLGTKDVTTYTTEIVEKTRPIWKTVTKTITTPDKTEIVTDATREVIRKAGMRAGAAAALGHVVEATDKALGGDPTRDYSKREIRQDRADEVEPARSTRTRRPTEDWTR